MDVFDLRDRLIDEYRRYVRSFMTMRDGRIRQRVQENLPGLWPAPSLGLNPAFQPGASIDELAADGMLDDRCRAIFRVGKSANDPMGREMRLHQHQVDAVHAARRGDSFVLTTGTGSGKSMAYIVPIVDHVLQHGSGNGVKAIVVYPMNALANSQKQELDKFLLHGPGWPSDRPPVRVESYTGQASAEDRAAILDNPPDVILTNYVMLELILTRLRDQPLVQAAQDLKFLVLDELHTYRGRQGADVALLVRRVRQACAASELQCVGTSATLATDGSIAQRQQDIAATASRIFGTDVAPGNVIGETLRRVTPVLDFDDAPARTALADRVRQAATGQAPTGPLTDDPLSSWIESTFGVEEDDGRLVRKVPRPISPPATGTDRSPAARLSGLTGQPVEDCAAAIAAQLLAGNRQHDPATGDPTFAFRLHQFVSKGDTVYASLGTLDHRHLTLKGGRFVPGHTEDRQVLLPLAFCRMCGQDFYMVNRVTDDRGTHFEPRDIGDHVDPNRSGSTREQTGFLVLAEDGIWPDDESAALERLPEDWLEVTDAGNLRVRKHMRAHHPRSRGVDQAGREVAAGGVRAWWMPTRFRLCLRCGVSYPGSLRTDLAKLATLGTEGRSTATTLLSLASVRLLRGDDTLKPRARKLLSFTDNRQDASLQAGHFNDFVHVVQLRGALHQALAAHGDNGLEHDEVGQAVFDALDLPYGAYAANPDAENLVYRRDTGRTLREVLAYHVYRDFERGWRLTSPNLEKVDLLRVEYVGLDEVTSAPRYWEAADPALRDAPPDQRREIVKALLDYLRRELAIKVDVLEPGFQERLLQRSNQRLTGTWSLPEDPRRLTRAWAVMPRSEQRGDQRDLLYLSARGGFGRFLRRTLARSGGTPTRDDVARIIPDLLAVLTRGGLVEKVDEAHDGTPAYQLPVAAMILRPGDGTTTEHDPIRMPTAPDVGIPINEYFLELYRQPVADLRAVEAKEHTAQVSYEDRQEREERFREADLSVLYCSPTMELGVDIAELNVVGMRNVPPTPANYAQRSGRAGRSGEPALVVTYCSSGSPHDRWYFNKPEQLVAGQVSLPRLDLTNEDLIRAHVHAIWLAISGLDLGTSLTDVLDVPDGSAEATLREEVQQRLHDHGARERARAAAQPMLAALHDELSQTSWWGPGWLDVVLSRLPDSFVDATQRWRSLYRSAMTQFTTANQVIGNMSASNGDLKEAKVRRAHAESQIELLRAGDSSALQSDFYSYRYFASEGFLPGYSFPRLPLSAYIPAPRMRSDHDGQFVSRPRFLAISEFGPLTTVYHEGNHYQIDKVLLPARDGGGAANGYGLTTHAKQCQHCGYLHEDAGDDTCRNCAQPLPAALPNLLRMQNVSTTRRDRISSDEEERRRQGFEIRTAFRFARRNGRLSARRADVDDADGKPIGRLTYGDTMTLWRINVGQRRRADQSLLGFPLDVDSGRWVRRRGEDDTDVAVADDAGASPEGRRVLRALPYVEDTRNSLLLEPGTPEPVDVMASVQTALKHAIQAHYQLEDDELAAEPLPGRDNRQRMLFYESAEGGAGVLRRLVEDDDALATVAREALALCHFDPDTGIDLRAGTGDDGCVGACYDCLLSYRNQLDHGLLDRHVALAYLLRLAGARLGPVTGEESVDDVIDELVARPSDVQGGGLRGAVGDAGPDAVALTGIEQEWLDKLRSQGFRLPSHAQTVVAETDTRPDFLYDDLMVVVYVDGPSHDDPSRPSRDADHQAQLRDAGYTIVRFGHPDDWPQTFDTFRWVFTDEESM